MYAEKDFYVPHSLTNILRYPVDLKRNWKELKGNRSLLKSQEDLDANIMFKLDDNNNLVNMK